MELALTTVGAAGTARPTSAPASAPAGPQERFESSPSPDAGMAAAQQLRSMAVGGNVLSQVPTSLVPMGDSHYQAKVKLWPFTKSLGPASAQRNDSAIELKTSQGDAVITVDKDNPNMVDVAVPGDPTKYQATLSPKDGGIEARTTDGKTVTVTPNGNGVDMKCAGFDQVPGRAVIIFTKS